MKKLLGVALILFSLCSCVGVKPVVNVSPQNVFLSTNPNLELSIDKSLRYSGKLETNEENNINKYTQEYHLFNAGNKKLAIILLKKIASGNKGHWLPLKIKEGENGVIIDQGSIELAGKQWKTFVQLISPNANEQNAFYSKNIDIDQYYITKAYMRNFSDRTQVYVSFMASLNGYEKDIEQYLRLKTLTSEQAELLNGFLVDAQKQIVFVVDVPTQNNQKPHSIEGNWKISGFERNGKYHRANFKYEPIFYFGRTSFDIVTDGESLLPTLKMGKASYSMSHGKFSLKSSTGEQVKSNIEFIDPNSFRVSTFGSSPKMEAIILSIKDTLMGIPSGMTPYSNDWKRDTAIYFSKI